MKRIVFYPDRPVDRPGDLFPDLVRRLGLEGLYEIEGEADHAGFVAFVGRARAARHFGRPVKTGPTGERWGKAEVYVLPSTAPEMRRRFFEGTWRNFAARVLGRDLAVRDEFKELAPEEIKARLDERRFAFGVACANVVYDFNLGAVVRTANAFLAREVLIYGRKKADLRGAMGSQHYVNLVHLPDVEAFERHVAGQGYRVVCFEQAPGAIPLPEFRWPENPLLVFGQEGPGTPSELLDLADHTVEIPQYGSIRSLNLATAAAIGMYAWHRNRYRSPSL